MRVQIYRLLVIMCCSTYSNSMNQPSKIVNPARRQLNRETVFFLSAFAPENLVSREGFGMLCFLCVFFPFILDIKFVGRTSRGHTGGRSHRISHPPSFCGACLSFSHEKDSAIPFPRRP